MPAERCHPGSPPGRCKENLLEYANLLAGHNLIPFAVSKNHIGLSPGDKAVAAFADRLDGYLVNKGTTRLPYGKRLPLELAAEIARWCGVDA